MLVLTRRIGESIVIDGNIRLFVTEIHGERVRLGIEAPPDVVVDRQEVHERRKQFADPLETLPRSVAPTCSNGVSGHARIR
jgi:carbon storage regulator